MIGPVIRSRRLAYGWTQLQLPMSAISRIERGAIRAPQPETLEKLSRALDVSVMEIYRGGDALRDPDERAK